MLVLRIVEADAETESTRSHSAYMQAMGKDAKWAGTRYQPWAFGDSAGSTVVADVAVMAAAEAAERSDFQKWLLSRSMGAASLR
jgi:hypothetical protein